MLYRFIVNPQANGGKTGTQIPFVRSVLDASGVTYELCETEGPGHAAELAQVNYDPDLCVVAVGGDGTLHEVCCGLMAQSKKVPLGVVPMGTGNDFVKVLDMPKNLKDGIRALTNATIRTVDVGWVRWEENGMAREEPFLNAVGIGFDAQVAYFSQELKHWPGMSGYMVAVIKTLRYWHCPDVNIVAHLANSECLRYTGPLLLATVGNGVSSGGAFYLTPRATIDDQKLNACVVPQLSTGHILRLLPKVVRGRHEADPAIETAEVTSLKLVSDTPLPIHTDGEVVSAQAQEIEVHIEANALPLLMPSAPL